jgi:hypothetical protein
MSFIGAVLSPPVYIVKIVLALVTICVLLLAMLLNCIICWFLESHLKRYLKKVEASAVIVPFPHNVTRLDYNFFWAQFVDWACVSNVRIIVINRAVPWRLPKSGRYVIVKSIPIGNVSPAFMLFLTKSDAVLYKLTFG